MGPESEGKLEFRFEAAAAVAGFDVPGLVMFFDLRKSIETAHDAEVHNGTKYNGKQHVLKSMVPALGPEEKATGPGLYLRALRAPSKLEVDLIKGEYGPRQKTWLERFPDS
jgi:hypothetical protein